jgi:4-oxalocrotonate tautomerase family enzyme
MIFITVKMPGQTFDSKKKDLLEKVSKAAADSLGIPVENVAILIDDTAIADNFAIGGKQFEPLSKQLEQIFTDGQLVMSESEEIFINGIASDCMASSVGLTEEQKTELFDKLVNMTSNNIINEDESEDMPNIDYIQLKEKLGQTLVNSVESALQSPQLMKQTIDKCYEKMEENEKKKKTKRSRKGKEK